MLYVGSLAEALPLPIAKEAIYVDCCPKMIEYAKPFPYYHSVEKVLQKFELFLDIHGNYLFVVLVYSFSIFLSFLIIILLQQNMRPIGCQIAEYVPFVWIFFSTKMTRIFHSSHL